MPGGDGTGPLGRGSLTGKGLGLCRAGIGLGLGMMGLGYGLKRGLRRGPGRGFGRMYSDNIDITPEKRKEMLKRQKASLESALDEINAELKNEE